MWERSEVWRLGWSEWRGRRVKSDGLRVSAMPSCLGWEGDAIVSNM